ncbi:MAG: hypothetical protein ACPGO3_08875 [Magnetospiraceae bacterium]
MITGIIFLIAVFMLAEAWRRGQGGHVEALKIAARQAVNLTPRIVIAVIGASFMAALLPEDHVAAFIGEESGLMGLAIATIAGAAVPAGPMVAFPIAAALTAAGAGFPQIITFLTGWSLLYGMRVLTYEIPSFGSAFVMRRLLVCLPFPPLAGAVAYLVSG